MLLLEVIKNLKDLSALMVSELLLRFKQRQSKNGNLDKLFKLDGKPKGAKTVLLVSLSNMNYNVCWEALLAREFDLRGYRVVVLTNWAHKRVVTTFQHLGAPLLFQHWLFFKIALRWFFKISSELEGVDQLRSYQWNNVNIGQCVIGSLAAKFRVGKVDWSNPKVRQTAKRYLRRAAIYLEVAQEVLDRVKPDLILANDKGYMGSNEIFSLAVERKIDFIQWCSCHESNTLMIKRYRQNNKKDHPFSVSASTWQRIKNLPWQEDYQKEVYSVFEQGYLGQNWFQYKRLACDLKTIDKEGLMKKYQLDPSKKIAVLFSHVMWDANLFYGEDLFLDGFEEWFVESAKAMLKNKAVNWLIKIHPANKFKHVTENIQGDYREIKALREVLGQVPEQIKIIYPEDNINPFSLFKIIDYAITVRGTIGAEFSCYGVPVLTAGTGRYSGRGFTIDSDSREEYLKRLLNIQAIAPLNEEQRRLAILHAFVFFKLRPLKFTSWQEKGSGLERDLDIKIKAPEQAKDIQRLVDWAINSQEEDLLNKSI